MAKRASASSQKQGRLNRWLAIDRSSPELQRQGQIVYLWNGISVLVWLVVLLADLRNFVPLSRLSSAGLPLIALIGALLLLLASFFLIRRGRVRPAIWLLLFVWLAGLGAIGLQRGPHSPLTLLLLVPIFFASVLLSPSAGFLLALLLTGLYLALLLLFNAGDPRVGSISEPLLRSQVALVYPALMLITGISGWLLTRGLGQTNRQVQERSLELEEIRRGLERRVQERTRELSEANQKLARYSQQIEISTQIGQATTRLLNLDELLPYAVQQIQEQFDYYQVSIFLLDEAMEWATIRGSAGQALDELIQSSFRLRVGQEGIVGQAISRRQPVVVQDVTKSASYYPHPLLPATRSETAIPLMVGEKMIGALDIQSGVIDDFDRDSVAVLQMVANQLAIAVENAQKFLDEAAILEETSSFHQFSRSLTTAATLSEVGRVLMDYTASTPVQVGRLLLLEKDRYGRPAWIRLMESWSAGEQPAPEPGTRLSLKEYSLASLIRDRSGAVVDDVSSDGRVNPAMAELLESHGVRSMALLPLYSGEELLGAWLVGRSEPSLFEPRLIRSYQSLAQQAGVVMESLRLLQETQQQAETERTLGFVAGELRSQVTVGQVMQSAAQQIGQLLGAQRVAIQLTPQPQARGGDGPGRMRPADLGARAAGQEAGENGQ